MAWDAERVGFCFADFLLSSCAGAVSRVPTRVVSSTRVCRSNHVLLLVTAPPPSLPPHCVYPRCGPSLMAPPLVLHAVFCGPMLWLSALVCPRYEGACPVLGSTRAPTRASPLSPQSTHLHPHRRPLVLEKPWFLRGRAARMSPTGAAPRAPATQTRLEAPPVGDAHVVVLCCVVLCCVCVCLCVSVRARVLWCFFAALAIYSFYKLMERSLGASAGEVRAPLHWQSHVHRVQGVFGAGC
jgi:hypothetical protein